MSSSRFVKPLVTLAIFVLALFPPQAEAAFPARGVDIDGNLMLEASFDRSTGKSSATIYERNEAGAWQQLHVLFEKSRDGDLGMSVDLNGDLAIVVLPGEAAHIYQRYGNDSWQEVAALLPSGIADRSSFGAWAALSGDQAIIGSERNVYVYEKQNGDWNEIEGFRSTDRDRLAAIDRDGALAKAASFSPFGDIRAKGAADPLVVNASDGTSEFFTEIQWTPRPASSYVQLWRGPVSGVPTDLLTFAASGDSMHVDSTGLRTVHYDYFVIEIDGGTNTPIDTVFDVGSSDIFGVENLQASDGLYEDSVVVRWTDASEVEVMYVVNWEDDSTSFTDTLAANSEYFLDTLSEPYDIGANTHYYEIHGVDENGNSSQIQDEGFRAFVAAPDSVHATDGEFPDSVVVTWVDRSNVEAGYVIYAGDETFEDSLGPNVTRWVDTAIAPGEVKSYCVAAVDFFGNFSPNFDLIQNCDDGSRTITAPESFQATDRTFEDRVELTWADTSGIADSLVITRNGSFLTGVLPGVGFYADSTGVTDVRYEYCIQALHSLGGSSLVVCDSGEVAEVLAPSLVAASDSAHEDQVVIVWDTESTNTMLFKVHRNGTVFFTGTKDDRTAVDTLGASEIELQYSVTAMSALGVESDTVSNSGSRVLNPPTNVQATDDEFENQVRVTWTDNSLAEVGFQIERYDGGGLDTTFATTGANIAVLVDTTGIPGIRYAYSVRTRDFCCVSAAVADSGSRRLESPTEAVASLGDFEDRIAVEWNDNSLYETGYRIIQISPTFVRDTVLVGSNVTSYIDSSIALYGPSNQYAHVIQTVDAFGFSDADTAIGHTGILTPGSFSASENYAGFVYLTWVDNSVVNTGYKIFRGSTQIATPGPDAVAYQDGGATSGVTHLYRAVATSGSLISDTVSTTGIRMAPPSNPGFGTVVINRPENVSASDGTFDKQVKITWDDQTAGTEEVAYRIYRDGVLLGSVGANITSFSDFGATPGITYEYWVNAIEADDDETTPNYGVVGSGLDYGRRPPDGSITGRVTTLSGAAVESVTVCLDPPPNKSILFDGNLGRIVMPVDSIPTAGISVEFWVKSSSVGANACPFSISQSNDDNMMEVRGLNPLRVFVNTSNLVELNTGQNYADGLWHHFAMTYNPGVGDLRVYKDGSQVGFLNKGGLMFSSGYIALGINVDRNGNVANAYDGLLDEVRIWDHIRTTSEIAANRRNKLDGTEQGLAYYWPLDQGVGVLAGDLSAQAEIGILEGGAHWSDDDAPIDVCALTGDAGNYVFSGIRYQGETTFKVMPELGARTFDPAFKTITLNTESPVQNEVGFNDVTSFTVSGFVRFEDTNCFLQNADILVDGTASGKTGGDGSYRVSVLPGTHVIEPVISNHTFDPPRVTINVTGDRPEINFLDTTKRTLSGQVGGGNADCHHDIGKLVIQTDGFGTSCFTQRDTLESARGNYNIALPAQKYSTQVVEVFDTPSGVDPVAVRRFFENIGPRVFDLTAADATLDFQYKGPLIVDIVGLPDPTACTVPPAAVIAQTDQFPLQIKVHEDYGASGTCPVDSEFVTIFDEIIDEGDDPQSVLVVDGVANYLTAANTPNVFAGRKDEFGLDRSYQKALTVVAIIDGQEPVTKRKWVIVTGHRARPGTFVTGRSEPITAFVLRDPPGDASSSYLEKGTTLCTTMENIEAFTVGGTEKLKIDTGLRFSKGFGVTFETKLIVNALLEMEGGAGDTKEKTYTNCVTTTERFSTSDAPEFVGDSADVFIGYAMNLEFAETDIIEFDSITCSILSSVGVAFDADSAKPFETGFAFTELHIRNSLIPQLQFNLDAGRDSSLADTTFFKNSIDNWTNVLAANDSAKASAAFDDNRSFSAGAMYEFSQALTNDTTRSLESKIYFDKKGGLGFEFEESGSGTEGEFFFTWTNDWITGFDTTRSVTTTIGYTLADGDLGDFYSVDVQKSQGNQAGGPIFGNLLGQTSCPFEPGTVARDKSGLNIVDAVQSGIDPDGVATMIVEMTNQTESDDLREYELRVEQATNPGGAVIKINGNQIEDGISFFIPPLQTTEATMTIERGPVRFRYDDLQLLMVPPCQFEAFLNNRPLEQHATFPFSVGFGAPCSDIVIDQPADKWLFNVSDGDSLTIALADFEQFVSARDTVELKDIGINWRLAGTNDVFKPIRTFNITELLADTLQNGELTSKTFNWYVGDLDDGDYELQAFTLCQNSDGQTPSLSSFGKIDRERPVPFGTPEPADSILSKGEDIILTFNEEMECQSIIPGTVKLRVLNPINPGDTLVVVQTVCDGSSLIIVPVGDLSIHEGKNFEAVVTGLEDLAGNPMMDLDSSATVRWGFQNRQSSFTWAQMAVIADASYRFPAEVRADLVNGGTIDLNYSITELPDWLVPDLQTGLLRAGESVEVTFAVSDTLSIGTHIDTITAVDTVTTFVGSPELEGDERRGKDAEAALLTTTDLIVRVDVTCQEPSWTVNPADYLYTMNLVGELQIPLEVADTLDQVAAYVGNEVRGFAKPIDVGLSTNRIFMTIYSNRRTGETVRFEAWDEDSCVVYPTSNLTFKFDRDQTYGTVTTPIPIIAGTALPDTAQTIPVEAGWNWFSLNLVGVDGMALNAILGNLNPTTGDIVKDELAFSQFLNNPTLLTSDWVGSLIDFDNLSLYQIKLSQPGTIQYFGTPVPISTAIPADAGWNWISYLPQDTLSVTSALSNLHPSHGDVVKGQDGFAQYIDSVQTGWFGNLMEMVPGEGYKLHIDTTDPGGFAYPSSKRAEAIVIAGEPGKPDAKELARAKAKAETQVDAKAIDWDVNPRAFEHNMTMTIVFDFEEDRYPSDWDKLGAFVGDEVRGIAELQFIPGVNRFVAFLMVHGKLDERVEFRYFDSIYGEVHRVVERVVFESDAVMGDVIDPFRLKVLEETIEVDESEETDSSLPVAYQLQRNEPNPFNPTTTIRYALPTAGHVELKVYDVAGREVMVLVDGKQEAGWYDHRLDADKLASGVYFYRITAGGYEDVQKMTLIR